MNACCSRFIGAARALTTVGVFLFSFSCSDAPRRDYGAKVNSFTGDCLSCHSTVPPDSDTGAVAADIIDTHYDDLQWLSDGTFNTAPTDFSRCSGSTAARLAR